MVRPLALLALFAVAACDQSPYAPYSPYQQTSYPYNQGSYGQGYYGQGYYGQGSSGTYRNYGSGQQGAPATGVQRWSYPDGSVRYGVYDPNTGIMK